MENMSEQEITRTILSVCSFNHYVTCALTEKSADAKLNPIESEVVEGLTFEKLFCWLFPF